MASIARIDRRFVYGANCAWWGSIDEIGKSPNGLPCCPHCGSMLFEMDTAETWWRGVDKFESAGHPGYRKFVEWTKGKHFRSFREASARYQAETGIEIAL